MPELPEVETIGNALAAVIVGQSIARVEVFAPAMRTPLAPLEQAELAGRTIIAVRRRGRYLVLELDDHRGVMMHFGMSGVVRVESPKVPRRKHEHIFFHLSGGEILRFECARRFSLCEVHHLTASGLPAALEKLGVEPLSEAFNGAYLYRVSRKRATPIKGFIMDNQVVVGVGNIYATEALFAAGIAPLRAAGKLTRAEAERLVGEIKEVLAKAIAAGGSTIRDYRHVDGSEGMFAQELAAYGRAGLECLRCGGAIATTRIGGRSSAYCPKCQK